MSVIWGLLAALGALAFVLGVNSAEAARVWSIYLVNLVFWSGLAATGPAIAGMMQLTEARWSPSVRRLALTTAGFLPVSFVLLVILLFGRKILYPWETTPIAVKAAWLNGPLFWPRPLGRPAAPAAVQDVAKLQFAFSIVWMYFFWSQYLVIWYGNVPVETRYVAQRFFVAPWKGLAWFVFVVGWLIPFAYLLKRLTGRPPQRHGPLVVVSVFGLVAIFLERVLVVFPSVSTSARLPFGARDLAITAGFLALFVLSRRWFFSQFKPVINLPHTGH